MNLLCEIGLHKWIQLEDETITMVMVGLNHPSSKVQSRTNYKVRICERCYRKELKSPNRKLVREATKSDMRAININKLL